MAAVDPNFASWLKDVAFWRTFTNGTLPAALLPMAIESELITPFATQAAADAENTRQGALLDGALALDSAIVKGKQVDLVGKCVTLTNDLLGYAAGAPVLVIGAAEQEDGTTTLQVLKAL